MSQLHEECGVFGLYTHEPEAAAIHTYHALYALQHRGQESAGIAINDDGVISSHKDVGLVSEVFPPDVLQNLGSGTITVGHVRYATTGNKSRTNAQPLVINHVKGSMVLAHNGNLTNAAELREKLELSGAIFHTTSDTEVIAYTITAQRLTAPSIEEAVDAAMDIIQGAYSLVLMSSTKLIAARDPNGFRPLCIGTMEDGGYVFASESCALDAIGAHFLRDVEPGEIVIADGNGLRSIRTHCNGRKSSLCVFEFIYFARPDSVIDGASVHEARLRAGAFLALEHPVQADIVIGVPDSGLDAAMGYARQSGIPYGIGFIKNKYIARTFIAPGQKSREDKVRIKLNPIASVVKGKRVVMIDDSIVRGTTSQRIVKLLRDAGAKEVHVRVSAPPFLHPCYFGTDIDSRDHLIACNHTTEEIAEIIGADSLGYLSVDSVHKLAVGCGCTFCDGCFIGNYPVAVPETREKFRFETKLSQRKD
mgnify:FL=1